MGNEAKSVQSASDASVVVEGNVTPTDGVGGFVPPATETPSAPAKTEAKKDAYGEGDHTPLFADEAKPSVEELTGPVDKPATDDDKPATSEPKADDDKASTTPEDGDKPKEDAKADEEAPKPDAEDDKPAADDDKPAEDGKTDGKPPKGYVPTQALQEERRFRQDGDKKIADLQAELSKTKELLAGRKEGDPPIDLDNPFRDFKVLSAEEEAELKNSPVDYVDYMDKKGKFEKYQEEENTRIESNKQEASRIIGASMNTIESEIPGFYTKPELREQAATFAADNGLPLESLLIVSNPGVQLYDPEVEGTVILGDVAADVMTFINRTQGKIAELEKRAPADEATLTKDIETRLRKELTEEFAGHFKNATSESEFRSLAEVTEADSSKPDGKKPGFRVLSEDELGKLSAEQREAYMRDGTVPA